MTPGDAKSPRPLGPVDAAFLVIGGILGVGIFFKPPEVAGELPGSPGIFFALWGVGAVLAVVGGLTFAELGRALPKAGGWYVYLDEGVGRFAAFLFAWIVLLVVSTGAIAVMVDFQAAMLVGAIPALEGAGRGVTTAIGFATIVVLTGLTLAGLRVGARFQSAVMIVKLLAVAALVGGAFLLFTPGEPPDTDELTDPGTHGWGAIPRALLPVLFAVGGWQMLCYVAHDVRDPERNVPRALFAGLALVGVAYLGLLLAFVRVLTYDGLTTTGDMAGEVARALFGDAGGRWLQLGLAVSALGVTTVTVVATPWLYVAMARRGLFFKRFARLDPRTGAPVAGLLLQAAIACVYLLRKDLTQLGDAVVFVEWFFHALVAFALLRLRRVRRDFPPPLVQAAHPWAPLVYLVLALGVVVGSLLEADASTVRHGLFVLAAGAVAWPVFRRLG
jgi:APA family basic amino acid/polyamine antiporter